ncbi:MAG: alpha/beta hydrolase [Pseudomonadota bacterium]
MAVAAIALAVGLAASYDAPDPQPWHTVYLDEEFEADMADEVVSFADYLALEDRLFEQLRREVYAEVDVGPGKLLERYSTGSAADPGTRQPNYNRSFERRVNGAKGGALLLHGMSDSPYSLRQIADNLESRGYWVVALRLPGHGTAPSGLKHARWEDMAAAVRLAMRHLESQVPDKPLHIVGYSNGAALALDYTLSAMDAEQATLPTSLVLISPAIGLTPVAALAGASATLGKVPGLSALAYTDMLPEFDPYKYNSFTANAGAQVYKLTKSVAARIAAREAEGTLDTMPPILVFKSTVDATVSTDAVVNRLLDRLPATRNELVLFDINRAAALSMLLVDDPGPFTTQLMDRPNLPFAIRLIANAGTDSNRMVMYFKPALADDITATRPLDAEWPRGVISLSHVAVPFPPDDPLYGAVRPADRQTLYLGNAEVRGERGLFRLSSDWLMRLRYNPFFEVLDTRLAEWLAETDGKRTAPDPID